MERRRQVIDDARIQAQLLFQRHFGHSPAQLVRAPASLTLLGDSADAAQGLALTVALDRQAGIAGAPRTDGRIELVTSAGAPQWFWLSNLAPNADAAWAGPIKAVLAQLRRRGVHFSGFSAAIHSAIPLGLDGSASVEVAVALLVRQLYPFVLTETGVARPPPRDARSQQVPPPSDADRRHLAGLCCAARIRRGGPPPSRAAYLTSLLGRAWHALTVDCQSGGVECWPFAGTAVVYCDALDPSPRGSHSPSERDEDSADRCAQAASKLGVQSLRSVEPSMLTATKARLDEREFADAVQAVAEMRWVASAEGTLREGDHRQLGQYLSLCHESAREHRRMVSGEGHVLVEIASGHKACLGARALTGANRSGIVSLVNYHEVEGFVAHLMDGAKTKLGRAVAPLVCSVVEGAG